MESKIVKHRELESRMRIAGGGRQGDRKILVKGSKASGLQDD